MGCRLGSTGGALRGAITFNLGSVKGQVASPGGTTLSRFQIGAHAATRSRSPLLDLVQLVRLSHGQAALPQQTQVPALTRSCSRSQHGVKRSRVPPVPDTAEVARKKQDKETKRIQEYTALLEQLYATVRLVILRPTTPWRIADVG